jgi:hypothetical protein
MSSAGIVNTWRTRPDLFLGALGLISGIVSAMWGMEISGLEWLQPVASLFGLAPDVLPIGVYFGLAIALGIWSYTGRLIAIPILLVTTMYAWSAAIQVAIRLQRNAGDDPHLIAASLGAGAVGAGLTHLGCAIIAPSLRRPARIAMTCVVGAAAGMLFYLGERKFVDERLLFLVWQPAVAFTIGTALTAQKHST